MMDGWISRGPAGDCCVFCGLVGIDLPVEHGCDPDGEPPEPLSSGVSDETPEEREWSTPSSTRPALSHDWERLWREPPTRRRAPATRQVGRGVHPVDPRPPDRVTAAQLSGILRTVASTQEGQRDSVIYWAACRFTEYGLRDRPFVQALANAARQTGQPDYEIRRAFKSAGLLS